MQEPDIMVECKRRRELERQAGGQEGIALNA
jgi:hypothetical protein